VNGTFVYFEQTNETFHLNEGTCTLGNMNQKPDFLNKFLDDFWMIKFPLDLKILGPSALLRLMKLMSQSKEPNAQPVVSINSSVNSSINSSQYLNECFNNFDYFSHMDLYFSIYYFFKNFNN